jgi:hypothetical protein
MVGAAMSRRAGLGSAATALVLVLTAGAGCASPARRTPGPSHPGARPAAAKPQPAVVSLPRVRGGVPWPVTLRTAGGMFVIGRNGAVRWLGAAQPARAHAGHRAGFVWVNRSAGTWAMIRHGRLVIMRNRAVIWRSAARYAVRDAAHMDWILAGRPGIAFEVHPFGPWFIASGRGPEHRVAAAGWPEMWSRSGNLIAVLHRPRSRSFGYAVYSPSGTQLATLATGLKVSAADQRIDDLGTGTFWYLTSDGNLFRTDGTATKIIANTHALGLTGIPEVWILRGGLVQLLSVSVSARQGQVILYPDGQLYARIPAPKGQTAGFGELSASPGRRVVAYVLTREPGNAATVFLVRPGGAPVAVYRSAHGGSPCSRPPLAWHGSWLLYTPRGGRAVLIDTAGSHQIIRLPPALPGSNGRTLRVHAVSWRLGLPMIISDHPVRRGA